jgi:hypothetical protein
MMSISTTRDLLATAMEAHGGRDRWDRITTIRAAASITGAVWHLKGRPDVLKEVLITADTQRERVTMDFPGQDKRSVFAPERIEITTATGELVEARDDPEAHFASQPPDAPWDDIDVAYFSGEALWTYLATPFLYGYAGFETEELAEPWLEDGEEWRRLDITFPDSVASHTRKQRSYFGPDGLLRRHDYTVDILGGTAGANYAYDYRTVDGIVVPATRTIYGYEDDHQVVREPVLVAITLDELAFS